MRINYIGTPKPKIMNNSVSNVMHKSYSSGETPFLMSYSFTNGETEMMNELESSDNIVCDKDQYDEEEEYIDEEIYKSDMLYTKEMDFKVMHNNKINSIPKSKSKYFKHFADNHYDYVEYLKTRIYIKNSSLKEHSRVLFDSNPPINDKFPRLSNEIIYNLIKRLEVPSVSVFYHMKYLIGHIFSFQDYSNENERNDTAGDTEKKTVFKSFFGEEFDESKIIKTSFLISLKYIDNLVRWKDYIESAIEQGFTNSSEMISIEKKILNIVNYDISYLTPCDFLDVFWQIAYLSLNDEEYFDIHFDKMNNMCQYILSIPFRDTDVENSIKFSKAMPYNTALVSILITLDYIEKDSERFVSGTKDFFFDEKIPFDQEEIIFLLEYFYSFLESTENINEQDNDLFTEEELNKNIIETLFSQYFNGSFIKYLGRVLPPTKKCFLLEKNVTMDEHAAELPTQKHTADDKENNYSPQQTKSKKRKLI